FGNGVCTYITSPITSGPPSWPRSTPVENVHATCSFLTLDALIWFSLENRVLALSPCCIAHCFGSLAALSSAASAYASVPCSANRLQIEVVTTKILFIRFLPETFSLEGRQRALELHSTRRRLPS